MKKDRIELYSQDYPKTFVTCALYRVDVSKLSGLPKSYFPREPKDGEHAVKMRVDPNGVQYERGDVMIDMPIESKQFPGLRGDWEIVQIKTRWTTRYDGSVSGWYRYAIVRPAKATDAIAVRAAIAEKHKRISEWAMNS